MTSSPTTAALTDDRTAAAPAGGPAGAPGWGRLALFLAAAALATAIAIPTARAIQIEIYFAIEVEPLPRDPTREQVLAERAAARRRNLLMDAAALAAAGALLAGGFGAVAGLCGPAGGRGAGGSARAAAAGRGLGIGALLGAAAGGIGAAAASFVLRSSTLAGWGGAIGDRQLFPAMLAFAGLFGLLGAAAGCAARLAGGKEPTRSAAGATRGPVLAGAAAGVVWGCLLPFVGVAAGTFTTLLFDARGYHRPVPLGLAGRALLLSGFGLLAAIALARVTGRPGPEAEPPAPTPPAPAPTPSVP